MKKILTILFIIMMTLSTSVNIFAGELDKNEKKVLKQLRDESFPIELEDRYINQLENYMYQDHVKLSKKNAKDFVKYLSEALIQKDSFENKEKSFGKFSSMYINFQKAGSILNLSVEYDSTLNCFYATHNEGYDVFIAIDANDIIKNTDKSSSSNQKNPDDEEKDWRISVEMIFAGVILLCLLGILANFSKNFYNIKIKKRRHYDDKEDTLEVAKKRGVRLQIRQDFYSNVKQIIKYLYVPIVMGMIVIIIAYFATKPIWNLYDSVRENFVNTQPLSAPKDAQFTPFKGKEKRRVDVLSIKKVTMPKFGEQYGRLVCENLGIDAPVFFGDRPEQLEKGAGTYIGSYLPGFGKTILIGAHDTTYFEGIEKISKGDEFTFTTTYGIYKYKVSKKEIYDKKFDDAYDLNADNEQLILYTCYPFKTLNGKKTQRMFVYLNLIGGPEVKR